MGTAASRLTEQILEETKDVESELIEHPFFRALLEDDIPEAAYLRWVREDTLFAQALRRVLGTLIVKAPDESSIDVLSAAYAPLNAEIDLFSSEARKGNVDFATGPMPATAKFIELLQSSADVGFAEGIGAYWAGERFYLDLWGTLLPPGRKGSICALVRHMDRTAVSGMGRVGRRCGRPARRARRVLVAPP